MALASIPLTPDDAADWRRNLEQNMAQWGRELRALALESKTKQRLLAVAETSKLRAGRYSGFRDTNGNKVDANVAAGNSLRQRLAELDVQTESLEYAIADAAEELATLPEAETPEPVGIRGFKDNRA